jgi:hypothetical protein
MISRSRSTARAAAVLTLATLGSLTGTARAETIDLGATTCAELLSGSAPARKFFVFWFDGYLAAKQGSTVSDADKMQKRLDRVLKACEPNPAQKLMPLMEKSQ